MQLIGKELTGRTTADGTQSRAVGLTAPQSAAEGELIAGVRRQTPAKPRDTGWIGRALDLFGALGMLVVLAPLMLVVAALVAITDPGPVIYAHRRVGRNGKTFKCYKFRSMRTDADQVFAQLLEHNPGLREEWQARQKLARDPRVTRIGSFLRTSSIDELPQLFNVLAGDMCLVGPRPVVADELPRYGRYLAHYLSVKPGLTGLWQVSGRSATCYHHRVAADVCYARKKSLALDLRILLVTIPAVLAGRGAY